MKKILALCLVVVLAATAVMGASMAYLTDTDEAVNVMTLGNVQIEQIEQERGEDGALKDFTQAKPAYPAVGEIAWDETGVKVNDTEYKVFADDLKNVVDKIVTVKNTGKSDAYVRTIIAIEAPDGDPKDLIHVNVNGDGLDYTSWAKVVIDGVDYVYSVFTYDAALAAGEISAPSLMQVFLDSATTNEDVAEFGDTWEILVLSQAVQTQGFADAADALETAFPKGENNANVPGWFGDMVIPVVVTTADALEEALSDGGAVYLTADISADMHTIGEGAAVTIDLNAHELSGTIVNNGELAVSGGVIESSAAGIENYGTATFTNVTMNAGSATDYSNIHYPGSETTYNNADIDSGGGGIGAVGGAKVVFNGGSVAVNSASTSGRYNFYTEGEGTEITINEGDFSFSKTLNQKRAYIYAGSGTTVYVNGGNFGKASTRSGYTAGILGTGTVVIKGGTFGFDPSNWVAEGYQAVKADGVWTVSAVANS